MGRVVGVMGRGELWVVEPRARLMGAQLLFLLLVQLLLVGQKVLRKLSQIFPLPIFFPAFILLSLSPNV